MRSSSCAVPVFTLAVFGILAHSQSGTIPFDRLQNSSPLPALLAANTPAADMSPPALPPAPSASGLVSTRPAHALKPRIVDRRFLLLNGIHLGLALFDIEMTQHCISEHKCREGNPIMPSSQGGQIGVSLGSVAVTAVGSSWARKHGIRIWWAGPAAGIAAHSVGVATGIALR